MIAMPGMLSTIPLMTRRAALLGAAALTACAPAAAPPGPPSTAPAMAQGTFVMQDGMRLPYRAWLPEGEPWAVVLALHGFNDSRDAWELPAPEFAAAGVALYAPDQRGFGATTARGLWPGADALADDAQMMAALLRARHPGARLVLMGESMGGAVLMHLATRGAALAVDGLVLLAPAVWGRAAMNWFMQGGLWFVATFVPGMTVSRPPALVVRVVASDNIEALRALGRNPLTIRATRFDTLRGLVDLMDLALAAAPRFPDMPALFLYGAKDTIIPAAATRTLWAQLPRGQVRRSYYPNGYHLLPRDLGRAVPIGDILAWLRAPTAALPSGGEEAAARWLERPAESAAQSPAIALPAPGHSGYEALGDP
jgi:alpha-beta hydrolase superfamily lysophospholipase